MCWHCQNPSATREEYLEVLRSRIHANGWTVQYIEGERNYAPFAYTIGLTVLGLPELVVTGTTPYRAAEILHTFAMQCIQTLAPEHGDRWVRDDGEQFEAVEVTVPDAHLLKAFELFGPIVRGVQLVYPDDRGHWPWEPGYRGRTWAQHVLGPRVKSADSA